MKNIREFSKKLKLKAQSMVSKSGLIYLFFSLCIIAAFYHHIGNAFNYKSIMPSDAGLIRLEPNVHYISEFKNYGDPIKEVKIQFSTHHRINHGTLHIRIGDEKNPIHAWSLPAEELVDNAFHTFSLDTPLQLNKNSKYFLDIYEEYEDDNYISVYSANSGGEIIAGNDVFAGKTFRCQWTMENLTQKRKYTPIYIVILIFLILFAAWFIDFKNFVICRNVFIFIIILLLLRTVDYDLFQNFATRVIVDDYKNSSKSATILPDQKYYSNISIMRSPFDTLEFFIDNKDKYNIYVELINKNTNACHYKGEIDTTNIIGDNRIGKTAVIFSTDRPLSQGQYTVLIHNLGQEDINVELQEDGKLNILAEKETYLAHKIAMFIIFLLTGTFIFFSGYAINNFKPHHLYLVLIIPLSIVYLILFVPWSHPDTDAHFSATYRLSNIVMGYGKYGKEFEWYGRHSDVEFYTYTWGKDRNPSLKSYSGIVHNINLKCEKPKLIQHNPLFKQQRMEYYSIINYLPETLGLSLGRALNLGSVLSLYMGRIFLMLLYIWATFRAVKRTPIGKGILAGVATLPISLMMSSAISYDPMVILSTLSFIASILYLYQYKNNKNSDNGLIEAVLWTFIIGAVKGGGYLILLPLVIILMERKHWKQGLVIICAGIISVVLFNNIMPSGKELFQFGFKEGEHMSAAYAFHHPLHFLDMCIESYIIGLDSLTINAGGTALAWVEIVLPTVIVALLMILTGIYSIFEKDDIILRKTDKYIMASIVLIGIIATPVMLLSWTTKGTRWIEGLQGRYYLPLFPLILIIFTKFSLHHPLDEKKHQVVKKKLIIGYVIFSFVAVYYLLRLYLLR